MSRTRPTKDIVPAVDERLSRIITLGNMPDVMGGRSPRAMRQSAIEEALKTDAVLCEMQLRRYFGADEMDLSVFPSMSHPLKPVHGRDYRVQVRFFSLFVQNLRKSPPTLGHFCGAGEMRLAFGAGAQRYRVGKTTEEKLAADPDGVLLTADGQKIAIEYDLGTYSMAKNLRKVGEYFEVYDAVLWGCPSELRAQRLRAKVVSAEQLSHRQKPFGAFTVEWWRGCAQIGRDAS